MIFLTIAKPIPYGAPLWTIQLAATTISVIPVLIFYVLAQRQVIESFTFSGVKG
jgi:multiple sugar transport system permease protein